MRPILETERLVFHPFTDADLPLLMDLHSDPEVQRFMSPDGLPMPEVVAQETLDRFVWEQAHAGFSKWKAFLRDGTFVGRAGVSPFPRRGPERGRDQEIGYAFKRAWWGSGLATEAAIAVRDLFFANTAHGHLIGFTDPGNHASQRILVKIGMTPLGLHDLGYDKPSALFRMERPT